VHAVCIVCVSVSSSCEDGLSVPPFAHARFVAPGYKAGKCCCSLSLVVIDCNDAIKQACRRRRRLHGMGVVLSLSVPARLLGYESFYGAAHNTQSGRPEQYSPSLDMR